MTLFDRIREQLASHALDPLNLDGHKHAAVAMLLQENNEGLEILLIQRAMNKRDVWSGHLALPGGRVEAEDLSPKHAAERETREEVGVDLSDAEFLGRLPDVIPIDRPIVVSCYVFGLVQTPEIRPEAREVADTFWFSPQLLADPECQTQILVERRGHEHTFPAVTIPGVEQPLWGITFKLLQFFRERTE